MKLSKFLPAVFAIVLVSTAFTPNPTSEKNVPVFKCIVNNKAYEYTGLKAYMRVITGGYKQLSLYNDLFSKFCFLNPSTKEIAVSGSHEAIIRYVEPGTNNTYYPTTGKVTIKSLDLTSNLVSGEFELELHSKEHPERVISVTKGQFSNIPIEVLQ